MAGGWSKVAIMPNAGAAVAFQVGFNDNETVKILERQGSSEFAGERYDALAHKSNAVILAQEQLDIAQELNAVFRTVRRLLYGVKGNDAAS